MTTIKNEKFKDVILTTLANKDMLNILNASQEKLISVHDIMKLFNIPHSTAYKKIKWMLDNELLVVKKMQFTDDGKKFSLFKSTIFSITVKYEKNNVTIDAINNTNIFEGTTERFFSLGD